MGTQNAPRLITHDGLGAFFDAGSSFDFYSEPLVLFSISCYAHLLPPMSVFACQPMSGSSVDCQKATFSDSHILSAHV